jgi:hypothetical protein
MNRFLNVVQKSEGLLGLSPRLISASKSVGCGAGDRVRTGDFQLGNQYVS